MRCLLELDSDITLDQDHGTGDTVAIPINDPSDED